MKKIKFVDFWPDFNPYKDPIFSLFIKKYNLKLDEKPNLIIFSVFGSEHESYNCPKLFYAAENYKYNSYYINNKFNVHDDSLLLQYYDFAITNYYVDSNKHLRIPAYLRKFGFEKIKKLNDVVNNSNKQKFCLFVVSNGFLGETQVRNQFFQTLNKYKKIDSAGKFLNNVGYFAPFDDNEYINFISKYKFMIAFENSSWEGYTSEKPIKCFESKTVPIYWGNSLIEKDFNNKSLILVDKNDILTSIEKVIYLDKNFDKYQEMLTQKPVDIEILNTKENEMHNFFDKIISHI